MKKEEEEEEILLQFYRLGFLLHNIYIYLVNLTELTETNKVSAR